VLYCVKIGHQSVSISMEKRNLPKKPKVFYGYWILVAAFFCFCIHGVGIYYAFSLFVKSLQADFGWGRGEIMIAYTINVLVWGLASPFIGRVVDRYGARMVILIGAIVSGFGFVVISSMSNLLHLYLGWAMVGVGMAGVGPMPVTATIYNWFKKRQGMAVGIASTGIGAGGFAMAPLIGGYLIPNLGWRTSYLALAVLIWIVIIPLALLVFKAKPADMGLYPYGVEAPENITVNKTLPSATEGLTAKMALATPALWLIGISFLLSGFAQSGVIQNQVPYIEDIGFSITTAAGALGGVGLGSLFGKLFFGWLCDQIQAKYVWGIAVSLQLAAIILLMNVGPATPLALLWIYAITMGIGMGGWVPAMSMLTRTTFGLASYGTIFGMMSLAFSIGEAAGPPTMGYMYDVIGTYHWAFIISAVLCALAIATILVVRRPKSP